MQQDKYRTFWKRFWANLIDSLVFVPILVVDSWFFARGFPVWANLLYYTLISCLLIYAYYVFMHGRYGQTLGKMVTGVKLLKLDEERLGYGRALLRDAVPIVLVILLILYDVPSILRGVRPDEVQGDYDILLAANILWFVVEIITMLTNKKRRALHDFIAGSVVVRL